MKRSHAQKKLFRFNTLMVTAIVCSSLSAQENQQFSGNSSSNSKGGWIVKDPFKSELFIENKGQFDDKNVQKEKIVYGVNNGEMHVYFTEKGLTYTICKYDLKDDTKEGRHELRELEEEEFHKHGPDLDQAKIDENFINKSSSVTIEWLGSNANAHIEVEDHVNEYFTYSLVQGKQYIPVKAEAYKKLIYKNIYTNIDIEYYFPENNKGGIKYNVIVHPGGDLSQVKMKYSGDKGLSIDKEGNLIIKTLSDPYTDHAPVSFYAGEENHPVKTKFVINEQTVSFLVSSYDTKKSLTVDPWVTNPGFTTTNKGYGIRVDYSGNCYVCGGNSASGTTNCVYEVKKFNNAGVIQWTYTTPVETFGFYGDIATDRVGNTFIGSGFNFAGGSFLIKINAAGTQTASIGPPASPNYSFECWKLSYNQLTNSSTVYMGGGGQTGFQLGKIATSLAGPVQIFNSFSSSKGLKDIVYIAQEKNESYIYSTLSANSCCPTPDPEDHRFVKVPSGAMTPASWTQVDPSAFMEVGQSSFLNAGGNTTGLNGMAVCDNYVYTHNGVILTAWDKATGASTYTANTGGTFNGYSGIDVDNCCRVYVGLNGAIKRYGPTLAFDISIPASAAVYDLKLDPLNDKNIYVTGNGFVQLIKLTSCPTCISTTQTNVSGCTLGTATATVNDPSATAPFTYSWDSSPGQTTKTATGLTPGTYIVTVSDAASPCPLTWKDTVIITGTYVPCIPTVTATGGTICSGACMSVTATGGGTSAPYTYAWQPGAGTGSSYSVCPTTTTTYTVVVTDGAAKTASTTAVVTVNALPTIGVPPATICNGTSATLTASGATTYAWSPGTGLNATSGTSVTANPTTTSTYTVTGTDANGCTNTTTVTVTVNPKPTITVPPATICNGASTALTASGANTYTWAPGTGLSGTTGTSVTANPTTTSTYTVIGTSAAGCTNSTTVTVTVNPTPTVTVPAVAICNGTSTTLTASGANTYTWAPATGLSGTTGTSVTANPTTTSTYTVTGTSAAGCTNTTTVSVTVNPNPVVSVSPATICNGASATLTASGATTYTWNPTTGLSSGTGTTVTANPGSTTTYTVTGSFATGCTGTTTVLVTVNPTPVITGSGATICQGQTTTLTASGASTYTWSPATGLSATTGTTVNADPTTTTTYTVIGTAINGCTGTIAITVTVNPPCGPSIITTGATVCSGVCATATSTATGGVPPYNYSWNTGATTSGLTDCPTVTTTYTVTVTDNSTPVGTASAIAVITVNPNPLVTVPPATICAGTTTTLTASGATTYSWAPPTGLSATNGATVTANPNTTTSYTVTGTNPTGCTGTVEVTVTVNPIPVVSVPNASICPGGSTTLNATGAATYTWSPATGLSATTGASVTANPASTTTYSVIGNSNGCTSSTTVTVSVGALVANAGPDVFICFGGSTNLNASGGTFYTWSPATGLNNTSISNPVATPTVTTSYTVTASDGTCSDDDVVVVTVNSAITLNAAGIDVTCNGACNGQLIVIPNGGTTPYTYSWSSGCTAAACNSICAGNYNLTATDAKGCSASATATVNEPTLLVSSLSNQTNVSCFGVCDGTATVSASGGTTPYSYSWAASGGAAATANGLCAGTFTCTITDANNCSVKTPVTITQPTAIVVSSTGATICPNSSATLSASTTGGSGTVTLTWSPATGLNTTSGASVTANPMTTTVYIITGTDGNGCIGTKSITVTVNPAPVINAPAATICQGTSATLTANGATTYSWSPASNLNTTSGATVIANPATTATYTIIGTNSFGCTNSTTVTVTVNLAPVVSATNGGACPGDTITLTASGASTYKWSPATGLSSATGSSVITSPVSTTSYTITGTDANGCTATAIAIATVHPKPVANFTTSPEPADLFNPTIYFKDQSTGGVNSWNWSLGDSANTKSSLQNPVHTYPAIPAKYLIHLVVTNQFGCMDSITSPLYIHGVFTFYIPNTFTPNNDGNNDGFTPKGTGIDETDYDLWIFDRWGNMIWHTRTWGDAWDGKANNGANIAQIDTYVWKVHVREKDSGLKHDYIGHVNIVK